MSAAFVHRRLVQFADTDLAGIVHFGRFFPFMEEAEHAFLRSRGLSVHDPATGLAWPRVHAECDYRSPAKFEETLDIAVTVAELTEKSVAYAFAIAVAGRTVATGKLVAACCRFDAAAGKWRAVAIPDDVRRTLLG